MKLSRLYQLILAGCTFLILLACNALIPISPTATSTPMPPNATSTPVSQAPVISTLTFSETGENPEYTINVEFPAMLDNNDPRTPAFNNEINTLVQGEVTAFKQNVAQVLPDPGFAASSFDGKYSLPFQNDGIASIKFDFSGYSSGAAHPYHYTMTVNYDVEQSRKLSLDELFLPGSNYLGTISAYCIAELGQRDIGFDVFSEGAAPTPENYRNWNITQDGMMITFDEYQVAAYAAGPQTVMVPYRELQAVINPEGQLGKINQ